MRKVETQCILCKSDFCLTYDETSISLREYTGFFHYTHCSLCIKCYQKLFDIKPCILENENDKICAKLMLLIEADELLGWELSQKTLRAIEKVIKDFFKEYLSKN